MPAERESLIQISDADRKKQTNERAIFRKFIRSDGVRLSVVMGSIRSRLPPQPDIYCLSASHAACRFELCELADQGMKDAKGNYRLRLDQFLDPEDVHRFDEKYDDCVIHVSRPVNDVHKTLQKVAHYLLSRATPPMRKESSSHVLIPMRDILNDPAAHGSVRTYLFSRFPRGKGASWHVDLDECFGDGIAKAIQDKSLKSYRVGRAPCKPQLLLYYNGDPFYMQSFPCEAEINRLRPVWTPRFTDVWVFDAQKSILILHEVDCVSA